jgi:hypothetical protein
MRGFAPPLIKIKKKKRHVEDPVTSIWTKEKRESAEWLDVYYLCII